MVPPVSRCSVQRPHSRVLGLVLAWRSDVIEPLPELQAVVDLTAADLEDEDARAILGSLHCLDPGSSLSVSATVAIDGERLRRLCSEIDPAWTVESDLPILDVVGQALAAAAAAVRIARANAAASGMR